MRASELVQRLQTILAASGHDPEVRLCTYTLVNGDDHDNLRDYPIENIGEGPHINEQSTVALWFHDPRDSDEHIEFVQCSDCGKPITHD